MTSGRLGEIVPKKEVVVVCGSGGVGKTTTSAALALATALHTDRKVLALTVDPARRLADALGIGDIGNKAVEVKPEGVQLRGQLFAAMLDAKESWDDLVRRYAPDAKTQEGIMRNPLYRNISERFVQSNDYIAMERLYELHASNEFDVVIVDTPPASHAIDFLDAPKRMAEFFDSRLLRFLVAPSRSRVVGLTARPFLQIADRLLGQRFLSEITELFTLLETMRPGFQERARQVDTLLHSRGSTFVVVTTLEPAACHEAKAFIKELDKRSMELGGVVTNRVLPKALLDLDVVGDARRLGGLAGTIAEKLSGEVGEAAKMERVFSELSQNFLRFNLMAQHEDQQRAALGGASQTTAAVPWLEELGDTANLLQVSGSIW